jgi:hypothetical protein
LILLRPGTKIFQKTIDIDNKVCYNKDTEGGIKMLIVLIEEFDHTPLYCVDELIYKRIRQEFIKTLGNDTIADMVLSKFWHYTLRQLSYANAIDIMSCFILL